MILVTTKDLFVEGVKPTIFPDGTSQAWHLSEVALEYCFRKVIQWYFEDEREIFDVLGVAKLLKDNCDILEIHIPYLPYARQDKMYGNGNTFNLHLFADMINMAQADAVVCFDVHNPNLCKKIITNFYNRKPFAFYRKVLDTINPQAVVFPDLSASYRHVKDDYVLTTLPSIRYEKVRDQETGTLTKFTLANKPNIVLSDSTLLIVDDICDGGATFIEVAKHLKEDFPGCHINLAVSHGIFSKGTDVLYEAGIEHIFSTDSYTHLQLIGSEKNYKYEVFEV